MTAETARLQRWAKTLARAARRRDQRRERKRKGTVTHLLHAHAKVLPVALVLDEEAQQHARVQARQGALADFVAVIGRPSRVGVGREEKVVELTSGVIHRGVRRGRRERQMLSGADERLVRREDERHGGSSVVRIDVEERVGLRADKVVRRRGAAAGNADRLRQTKNALSGRADGQKGGERQPSETHLNRLVVDRVHAVDAQADIDEHEHRRLPLLAILCRRRDDLALIHGPIDAADDPETSRLVRVDEGLDRAGGCRRAEPLADLFAEQFALLREAVDRERRDGRGVVKKEREDAGVGCGGLNG